MARRRSQRTDGLAGSILGPHSFKRAADSRVVTTSVSTLGLHICPECACELVYPLDWEPAGHEAWRVTLRCPECEWRGGGEYAQDVVDRLDEALDDGTAQLLEDLGVLARANMEGDVQRLIAALHAGAILPEDF